MDFGSILKELRNSRQLTQLQLSQILETSKSNISKYEAGSVEPSMGTLVKISEYFNVSIDSLLGTNDFSRNGNLSRSQEQQGNIFFFDDLLRDVFSSRCNELLKEKQLSANSLSDVTGIDVKCCNKSSRENVNPPLKI